MKIRLALALLATAGLALLTSARAADTRVYELRTYTTNPGKLPDLLTRFRDHTTKIFEKHGMVNVGYWVPTDADKGADNTLVYMLEHKSREAATESWKNFRADPVWQDVAKKSEANGKIVAKVDSVFLTATDFAQAMNTGNGKGDRVFELRTYTAVEGRLAALDARFRDHTIRLFGWHGMTSLGYFHPADADKGAANTLIYFLAYPSREAAAASWKAFGADDHWKMVRAESERDGKLTTKVVSLYLKPTDFSPIK